MDLNFTALDFETANTKKSSVCSIGLVRVENGEIVEEYEKILKPEPFYFRKINTNIHGIKMEDCFDAPTFKEIWPEVKHWMNDQIIVGHNVLSVEKSILFHLADFYDLDFQPKDFLCTMKLSRVELNKLTKHSLPNVYFELFKKTVNHHNALEDARACAEIAIDISKKWSPPTFAGMTRALYEKPVRTRVDKKEKVSLASIQPDKYFDEKRPLKGLTFAFTGNLSVFTKEEAAQIVVNCGAKANDNVTKSTSHLVVGSFAPKYDKSHKSGKMKKADEYSSKGQKINQLAEEQFIAFLKEYTQ